jgi:hypothetical protein
MGLPPYVGTIVTRRYGFKYLKNYSKRKIRVLEPLVRKPKRVRDWRTLLSGILNFGVVS